MIDRFGADCRYHSGMDPMLPSLPQDLLAAADRLLQRAPDCHKYDFGRVLVIGGSRPMAGAPALAGMAALRGGAGLVEVGVPQAIAPVVAGFDPALIVHGLPEDADGHFGAEAIDGLLALAQKADVLVCGPGMGRGPSLADLVERLWRDFPRLLVLDADGLNALAGLPRERLRAPAGSRLLTPHAGEMQRLLGDALGDRAALEAATAAYAAELDAVLLLKGHRTLVTDGVRSQHNASGGPGLATAGTGDVLSGLLGALAAQGLTPFEAARLGAWLHGVAGEFACEALTAPGMTAGDVLEALPMAWKALAE